MSETVTTGHQPMEAVHIDECVPLSDRLSVSYDGNYNEAGRTMVRNAGPDA